MRRHLGTLPAAIITIVLASTATLASPAGAEPDLPGPTVPAAADPGGKAAAAGAGNRAERAKAALATVQAMFEDGAARARRSSAEAPDLTLALRELSMLKGSLSRADRARADSYFARPTDGVDDALGHGYETTDVLRECGAHVCVHYVTSTADAVPLADTSPANAIPDYVEFALATLESVHTKYTGAGYHPPKSDEDSTSNGGDGLTDVYLADIGTMAYGYCTSDDPNFETEVKVYPYWDASAYCVLDNDYSSTQFPARTVEQNFQVTAAHEYFHAVQFAYDYYEDLWLLEATATWVEDEVYDTIDDNRQFLSYSPLSHPGVPLDSTAGGHEYGDWVFFRHLTERFPTAVNGLPTFVRDVFTRADGSPNQPGVDQVSMQAVRNTIASRGTTFAAAFTRFGALNRRAKTTYNEGATYPISPLAGGFAMTTTRRTTNWRRASLHHLTNATARFTSSASLKASDWRLRINLALPTTARGSAATVQVYRRNGSVGVYPVTLNSAGDATRTFPFAVGSVKYVEVTLTNASTRFNCGAGTSWTCGGVPLDDNQPYDFRATVYRS